MERNTIDGSPTKEFFINMLTRDIALEDAILDLLDNCLDGVLRSRNIKNISEKNEEIYKDFNARITISSDSFIIEDNCGGIPLNVAIKKAFRMGFKYTDESIPTVGVYGIGMKRAIFKMGQSAKVISNHEDDYFQVNIDKEWKDDPDNWDFNFTKLEKSDSNYGTKVIINDLHPNIAEKWQETNTQLDKFVDDLKKAIQVNYSLIIKKGFSIYVNEEIVLANKISFLYSPTDDNCDNENGKPKAINPYIYKKTFEVNPDEDKVKVNFFIGFYDSIPDENELDEYAENKRSADEAGWTIVCNDRIVVYNDKTHLTGWGTHGVPKYHNQFIGIRGIVFFESTNPELLPMTTTKRGIDQSSDIYAEVKRNMIDALVLFTSYTNRWKGRKKEEREYSKIALHIEVNEISKNDRLMSYLKPKRNDRAALVFKPELPKPVNNSAFSIIRFSALKSDIEFVKEQLFDDESIDVKASEVGEKCFEKVRDQYKGNQRGDSE